MYVNGIVPGASRTFIVPQASSGAATQEFDLLIVAVDPKGQCHNQELREAVRDLIAAGHISVLPEILVELIAKRLQQKGLEGAHLKPEISRTLGSRKFWAEHTRELIFAGCAL